MSLNERFLSSALMAVLAHKSRPLTIRMNLARRRAVRVPMPTRDRVLVGVVQMRIDLVDDGEKFADKMYGLVSQAVERGAQLVVFPEYAWMPILGLLPPMRPLAEKGVSLDAAAKELAPGGVMKIADVFRAIAPAVNRIFETTASELATRFGIYLMAGTTITFDEQARIYSTAYLFAPNGEIVGTQPKLRALPMEQSWLTVGKEFKVFDLPFARVAMPIGLDNFEETKHSAVQHGAEILLGSFAKFQETLAYGTSACGVTNLFGLNLEGPSSIVAPLGMLANDNIFLAQTETHDEEEVIVAELDLAQLREYRAAHHSNSH